MELSLANVLGLPKCKRNYKGKEKIVKGVVPKNTTVKKNLREGSRRDQARVSWLKKLSSSKSHAHYKCYLVTCIIKAQM